MNNLPSPLKKPTSITLSYSQVFSLIDKPIERRIKRDIQDGLIQAQQIGIEKVCFILHNDGRVETGESCIEIVKL